MKKDSKRLLVRKCARELTREEMTKVGGGNTSTDENGGTWTQITSDQWPGDDGGAGESIFLATYDD